jgi:hypothetical protein
MVSYAVQKTFECSVLNTLTVYRQNFNKPVEHLSFWVLLVEGLFSK